MFVAEAESDRAIGPSASLMKSGKAHFGAVPGNSATTRRHHEIACNKTECCTAVLTYICLDCSDRVMAMLFSVPIPIAIPILD